MAVLRFDVKSMNLDVIVGLLEQYKPSKEVKALNKSLEKFKKEYSVYIKKQFKTEDTKEIMVILDSNESKKQEFVKYLQDVASPKISEISKEVERLNKQLCPNFEG